MKHIPGTVWRLMVAYSLMMAGTSLMVLLAGIIGTEIAPSADLATLPIALVVVGVAASTLPTGKLLHRFGRRRVFITYGVIAIAAALLAMQSLVSGTFTGFPQRSHRRRLRFSCWAESWQLSSVRNWLYGAGDCSTPSMPDPSFC